jgi:hypothetical protein
MRIAEEDRDIPESPFTFKNQMIRLYARGKQTIYGFLW